LTDFGEGEREKEDDVVSFSLYVVQNPKKQTEKELDNGKQEM
jgi:hypothetical protein